MEDIFLHNIFQDDESDDDEDFIYETSSSEEESDVVFLARVAASRRCLQDRDTFVRNKHYIYRDIPGFSAETFKSHFRLYASKIVYISSVFAGYAGSVHDARVFRVSPVKEYLGNPEYFPDNSHLIGDAAYGVHPNIMVPFRDNGHLTFRQKNFNFCLSSARMSIERVFGLWKTRWWRIRDCLHMIKMENVSNGNSNVFSSNLCPSQYLRNEK